MSLQGPRRHQALGRPGRRRRQPDQHRPRHGRSARALTASFDHNSPWQAAAPTAAAIVLSSPAHAPRETSFLRRKVVKHWQDPVNAVLGVWLIGAPWAFAFQAETAAVANSVVIGLALLASPLAAIVLQRVWEEWVELALGLWLIASSWVLGFSAVSTARTLTIGTGIVVAALAVWVLLVDRDNGGQWRKRIVHQ